MQKYDTHVCLVSQQATPNLLPILDEEWRPRRVVLACSKEMKKAAESLRNVIKTKKIKESAIDVELLDLPNAYDYSALSDAFLNYLAEHESENIALNVTGGTKLMAVAAQEVFREAKKSVFYVNIENDEVLVLGQKTASQALTSKLKVHEMLKAYGYAVDKSQPLPQITRERRDLMQRLIERVDNNYFGSALGMLNELAHNAKNNLQSKLKDYHQDSRSLHDIVSLFENAGFLKLQDAATIVFENEEARFFANGGWLEFHVLEVLQSLRGKYPNMSDIAMGVRIPFSGTSNVSNKWDKNEIDIAFLYRNTLHLIECKTANLSTKGHGNDDKATEALYKIESLLKLGGLRTKGMIVDYRGEFSKSEANQKRAADARIEIASGSQLKNLEMIIQQKWLSTPQK